MKLFNYLQDEERDLFIEKSCGDLAFEKAIAIFEMAMLNQDIVYKECVANVLLEDGTEEDFNTILEASEEVVVEKKKISIKAAIKALLDIISKAINSIKSKFDELKKSFEKDTEFIIIHDYQALMKIVEHLDVLNRSQRFDEVDKEYDKFEDVIAEEYSEQVPADVVENIHTIIVMELNTLEAKLKKLETSVDNMKDEELMRAKTELTYVKLLVTVCSDLLRKLNASKKVKVKKNDGVAATESVEDELDILLGADNIQEAALEIYELLTAE